MRKIIIHILVLLILLFVGIIIALAQNNGEVNQEEAEITGYTTVFTYEDNSIADHFIQVGVVTDEEEKAFNIKEKVMTHIRNTYKNLAPSGTVGVISRMNLALEEAENLPISFDLTEEVAEVLSLAEDISRLTEERYSYIMRPLYNLWQRNIEEQTIPSSEEVAAAKSLCSIEQNQQEQVLNSISIMGVPFSITGIPSLVKLEGNSIRFSKKGMGVDFGYGLPGLLADAGYEVLVESEVEAGFVNVNGTIHFYGRRPSVRSESVPWKMGILNPRTITIPVENENNLLDGYIIYISDQSIATVGDYNHFFIDSIGRRAHDVINPTSGYPANFYISSGGLQSEGSAGYVISATVIGDSAAYCAMIAQALLCMGTTNGINLVDQLAGYETLLIVKKSSGYDFIQSTGLSLYLISN